MLLGKYYEIFSLDTFIERKKAKIFVNLSLSSRDTSAKREKLHFLQHLQCFKKIYNFGRNRLLRETNIVTKQETDK
jgi:hypothetical protein